eukprot:scaffold57738_cov40-Prasinocladus_malaysianus.AAC.3
MAVTAVSFYSIDHSAEIPSMSQFLSYRCNHGFLFVGVGMGATASNIMLLTSDTPGNEFLILMKCQAHVATTFRQCSSGSGDLPFIWLSAHLIHDTAYFSALFLLAIQYQRIAVMDKEFSVSNREVCGTAAGGEGSPGRRYSSCREAPERNPDVQKQRPDDVGVRGIKGRGTAHHG